MATVGLIQFLIKTQELGDSLLAMGGSDSVPDQDPRVRRGQSVGYKGSDSVPEQDLRVRRGESVGYGTHRSHQIVPA